MDIKRIEENLTVLDYFAARIYSLECELSNEFSWSWLSLNDNVRDKYKQKAMEYFEKYESSQDNDFKNKINLMARIFKKHEISKKTKF